MLKWMLVGVLGIGLTACSADETTPLPGPTGPTTYGDHFMANPPPGAPLPSEPPATAPPVSEDPPPPSDDPPPPSSDDPPPPSTDPPPAADDPTVGDDPEPPGISDQCVEGPNKKTKPFSTNVYYGTEYPQYLPMTDGQIMAVGNFWGCSGLLIAPTWVLSAEHCGLSAWSEFCIGVDASNPNVCIQGKNAYNHPWGDIALLELSEDATQKLPGVEPVPIFTGSLDQSWIGTTVEAAGYGSQENGSSNEREFTAEPLVWLGQDTLTIDGEGKHGVCFGDSGGPVMVIAEDGSVRTIGALSNGSDSCVGQDNYTRVDTYRDWIEGYTGPTVAPGPQPCGDTSPVGFCNSSGTRATWCGADDLLETENCSAGDVCSWSVAEEGWRCIPAAQDPCQGVTLWGACDQNTLSWCDEGGLQTRSCGECEETCVPNDAWGYWCVPSTCGDLLFTGECIDSSTVRWCNRDGEIETQTCSWGQSCTWVDAQTGNWCQ